MSQANVEQFYKVVQNSQQLQEQLGAAENKESFNELAVRLGQENGYTFTAEEVDAFINQKSQEANAELSDQELEAVAGGGQSCPGPLTTICAKTSKCWGSYC
jgi:predicted ribosomally synthesized peptide with nif11-like leader